MSSLKEEIKLIEKGRPILQFDYYCYLLSFPLAFKTTLHNIPAKTQYLHADESKTKYWSNKLDKKNKLRIGLVWSGSKSHKNDHNRSLLLKQLSPLLQLPFEFHSLQKEIRECDRKTLNTYKSIYQHQDDLKDLSDTAALIEQMDLIISVDTSVAHLAGALGKQIFILLPFIPDYRWMLDRRDTPWYPSAILFRQPIINDWCSVILNVKETLQKKYLE
jgi:ADP-heptose:LPS heptosyltransferase